MLDDKMFENNMQEKEIHLRDYLRVVAKHRGLIISFVIVVTAIVALVTFSATPQYLASSKVLMEKANNNTLTDGYAANFRDPEFFETQFQLIKSRQVARRVVDILGLENSSLTGTSDTGNSSPVQMVKTWLIEAKNSLLGSDPVEDESSAGLRSEADRLADEIRDNIRVSPVRDSRIVAISYPSANPEFAALIVNTVVKAYTETSLEMKMAATRQTLEWMTKKTESERLKLEKSEKELQTYMRTNNLVTLENRIAVLPQKLSQISSELVTAQNKRQKLEGLYRKVKSVAGSPDAAESVLGISNGATLQILRDQILKAEQYIRELSAKYGAKHPTMIKAKGDLEILQNKKQQEISRLTGSVKDEFELAVAEENNLRQQLEQTKAEAHNLNEKFIQYEAFQREMDTNRQLYDTLMMKMKEQNITGEIQPVNLWVVEQAEVPVIPFKPNKKKNLVLAFIVSLFGGIGLAFFVEYLDQSIKYPEETEQALGFPVLGMVPLLKGKEGNIDTVMKDLPRSAAAENYRSLRTSVMLSSSNQPPRKILVTSPEAGAGKSTTAINLAVAMAQSGKKVLLIDADMRKPRLHKIFKIKPEKGLSSYLAGISRNDVMFQSPIENLFFMPAGPVPPNPSELLVSDSLNQLLSQVDAKVDFIVCDSPPLQSVVDARILSQVFDGTILVVKGKQTTFEQARKSLRQLNDVNAQILGVLINGIELKKNDYYYANYYGTYGDEPTS